MTRSPNKVIPEDFPTLPGLDALAAFTVLASEPPSDTEAIGYTVYTDGGTGLGPRRPDPRRFRTEGRSGIGHPDPERTGSGRRRSR